MKLDRLAFLVGGVAACVFGATIGIIWFLKPPISDGVSVGADIKDVSARLGPSDPILSAVTMQHRTGPIVGEGADAYFVWKQTGGVLVAKITILYVAVKASKVTYVGQDEIVLGP